MGLIQIGGYTISRTLGLNWKWNVYQWGRWVAKFRYRVDAERFCRASSGTTIEIEVRGSRQAAVQHDVENYQ